MTPTTTHPAHLYDAALDVYYRPEIAVSSDPRGNYSRSPSKPRRYVEHLLGSPLAPLVVLRPHFAPVSREQLLLAHRPDYVDAFLSGRGRDAASNGVVWSPEFADTVRYTNGSVVAAIRGALARPGRVALTPTSGFHHARPNGGGGFCTFSGQVIAAVCAWREHGARGAWVDLDGHFGNSIEDSRAFAPELADAIPVGCNLNPDGEGADYLADLERRLARLGERVLAGEIHYVAVAHGADSHVDDDLGGQVTTAEWLTASELVYGAIGRWSAALGRPVPLVLALFGGYRHADPDAVLALHAADNAIALEILAGVTFGATGEAPQPLLVTRGLSHGPS